MRISYETAAKKLEYAAPDVINYSDVHPHDPKKVIAFSAPAAAPHPSMRSRHRRMARRALRMQKLLVAYPRYACVALLASLVTWIRNDAKTTFASIEYSITSAIIMPEDEQAPQPTQAPQL